MEKPVQQPADHIAGLLQRPLGHTPGHPFAWARRRARRRFEKGGHVPPADARGSEKPVLNRDDHGAVAPDIRRPGIYKPGARLMLDCKDVKLVRWEARHATGSCFRYWPSQRGRRRLLSPS